jgi:hypothetical protein
MHDDSGSIVQVAVNGVGYDVMADADFDPVPSGIKTEGTATSGRTMMKRTYQVQEVKSVDLAVNGQERTNLQAVAEGSVDVTLSYTTMAGDSWKATGRINFESWKNLDQKGTLTMIPRTKWVFFGGA